MQTHKASYVHSQQCSNSSNTLSRTQRPSAYDMCTTPACKQHIVVNSIPLASHRIVAAEGDTIMSSLSLSGADSKGPGTECKHMP